MGELKPDHGTIKWAEKAKPGYFAQDHSADFDSDKPLTEWITEWVRAGGYDGNDVETLIRGTLGRLLFSGDEVKKPVRVISGGEQGRMLFGKLMLLRPNVLLMDEPTNHLDMESIESLNNGLDAFTGTLIFVSHDRQFVSSLANKIIELKLDGSHVVYEGGYEDYLASQGLEFQHQAPGVDAGFLDIGPDHVEKVRMPELTRTDIDRHRQMGRGLLAGPGPDLFAGLAQQLLADGNDESGFLRHGDEHQGRQQAALGMGPARQGLDPGHATGLVDLGLVMQDEFPALDGPAQLGFQARARLYRGLHGGIEETNGGAPGGLGLIHGQIGPLQYLLHREGLILEQGHADAGGTVMFDLPEQVVLSKGLQNLGGHHLGLLGRGLGN
jgi:energy-coupling factor transporter ATP-binding protein EcfA2